MANKRPPNRPAIIVGHSEHRKLTKIAEAYLSKNAVVSDELLYELERAHVVDDHRLPRGIIRLGSTVRFTSDLGEDRTSPGLRCDGAWWFRSGSHDPRSRVLGPAPWVGSISSFRTRARVASNEERPM